VGIEPVAFAYASAIRAHEAAGEWEVALQLFDRLTAHHVHADAHCYCAALGACRRGAQAERAEAIMATVEAEGRVAPTGAMTTLAMAACNAGQQWETSLRLFDEHKARAGPAAAEPYGYSVAIGACAQGRHWERALALLEEMETHEACKGNAFAWNHAMVACTRGGVPHKALELYDRMRKGACVVSEHSVAAALSACRESEGEAGADWQRAQAIFDGHHDVVHSSQMCHSALLDALADAEQWQLLLTYFDDLKLRNVQPSPRGAPLTERTRSEHAVAATVALRPRMSVCPLLACASVRASHRGVRPRRCREVARAV
jgi:pentatricopeptide repeat protein